MADEKRKLTHTAAELDAAVDMLLEMYTREEIDGLLDNKINATSGMGLISDEEKQKLSELENYDDTEIKADLAEVSSTLGGKVDKEFGKGLSTNDFTDADKSKLDSLENYDDADIKNDVAGVSNQAAVNKATLGYSAKNLLENTAKSTTVVGLSYTVNEDKSVTLNGTIQSGKTASFYVNSDLVLPRGQFKKTKGFLIGTFSRETGSWISTIVNTNTETFDTSDWDYDNYIYKVNIQRTGSSPYDNVVIYPMIYPADITGDTYEPYKPSVEERLAALEEKFAALEGGST